MLIPSFTISRLPAILFGHGQVKQLPALVRQFGQQALLVTGARSFRQSPHWEGLVNGLAEAGVEYQAMTVSGEPSPAVVDEAVAKFLGHRVQVVVGIGGGSVLDSSARRSSFHKIEPIEV